MIYIENSLGSTKMLLELIHDVSKFAGYKISIEKLMLCLYTSDEQLETEI